jgi:hypothetical protein
MSRNYERPCVDPHWADSCNTHPVVAAAIHAIADTSRSAEAIWQDIERKMIQVVETQTRARRSTATASK